MGARPVWRVGDRASFEALRRRGRRVRRGPVSVTFVPFEDAGAGLAGGGARRPRVAFAVGRAVGGAVERNRLRRRLRAVVDELARDDVAGGRGGVPAGTYLVSARAEASAMSSTGLRDAVADAVSHATAAAPARGELRARGTAR